MANAYLEAHSERIGCCGAAICRSMRLDGGALPLGAPRLFDFLLLFEKLGI